MAAFRKDGFSRIVSLPSCFCYGADFAGLRLDHDDVCPVGGESVYLRLDGGLGGVLKVPVDRQFHSLAVSRGRHVQGRGGNDDPVSPI